MGITLYRGLNDSFKINSGLLSSVHERLKLHQFLDIPPVIYHHASRALSYGTHALCNKKIKQKETKEALLAGWEENVLKTELIPAA